MDLYIDVGSTNIKWTYGETAGKLPFPAASDAAYPHYEVCADEIFSAVSNLIDRHRPRRVFFSVQMHGYVLLKSGREATGYISWRDERAAGLTPDFALTEEYGVGIKPNLPRLSLQAQLAEADEFCTLGSYLVYRLTGNNQTHITDGAASGFFNVVKRTADSCEYILPEVFYSVKEVGRYGTSAIFTPVGDQQAAVLGAMKYAESRGFDDCYVLNLGTAAQLCTVSEQFARGNFESRAYFGGKTLCTVTGLPGGGYISSVIGKMSAEALIETLVEAYLSAVAKLPERARLLVTGGVIQYHKTLIEKVLELLKREYVLNEQADALEGLKIISEEVE